MTRKTTVRVVCAVFFICIASRFAKSVHWRFVMLAQEQDATSPASKIMPFAHDAESLAAIGARSADASRAWLHNRLGRADVEILCLCPA